MRKGLREIEGLFCFGMMEGAGSAAGAWQQRLGAVVGGWGRERWFQVVPPSYVVLRPTAPGAGCLGFSAENPLWRQRSGALFSGRSAELCCASADSSRRGMSWKICRFSAARPEPRSALEPPGLAPFRRLFRFSASVDRQMTPALFARLFRASRFRLAHWRTGCRAPLRGPSDLKHHAAPDCREGMASVGLRLPGEPSDLKHHAACGLSTAWGCALKVAPPAAWESVGRRVLQAQKPLRIAPRWARGRVIFLRDARRLPSRGASGLTPPSFQASESMAFPDSLPPLSAKRPGASAMAGNFSKHFPGDSCPASRV